jgi:hypothetical protein
MIYLHGFSTKKNGDMRENQNVISFLASEPLTYHSVIRPQQTHSDHVQIIDTLPADTVYPVPDCDGVVTRIPNLVLTVITADCVPILFIDKKNGVVGASHQGWKGTYARMAEKTVQKMLSIGANMNTIEVTFGPSISGECYQIPKERYEMFKTAFPSHFKQISQENKSNYTLDLQELNIYQLSELGIQPNNITQSDRCTLQDQDLYSFRGDTTEEFGEIVSYVVIK